MKKKTIVLENRHFEDLFWSSFESVALIHFKLKEEIQIMYNY